ncbi:MAG TPA: hypothetical protein VHO25_21645 [Polyangiaceae bacterium]|nr:hypothetical protein [Polyangiaceae bacterium]
MSTAQPSEPSRSFWSGVDAKFLIVTLAGLSALLGPITQAVDGYTKARLAKTAAGHQQRLDFIDKLVKAQELDDESQRVLARLDVLRLLSGTLEKDDGLNSFVTEELTSTRKQYDALLKLQIEREKDSETPAPPHPVGATPSPKVEAEAVKVARREVTKQLLLTSPFAESPSAIAPPTTLKPCQRYKANAPGSALSQVELEAACRAADSNAGDAWMARQGAVTVLCQCTQR